VVRRGSNNKRTLRGKCVGNCLFEGYSVGERKDTMNNASGNLNSLWFLVRKENFSEVLGGMVDTTIE